MAEFKIKSDQKPVPKKLGTAQTIDMRTGKVTAERKNAFTLMGPPPDKCQICATAHDHDQPHNKDSLYYQMAFHASHGRWPTWTDSMAHCDDKTKALWTKELIKLLTERGLEIPDDLLEQKPPGR